MTEDEKFDMKVTAIEEAQDITTLKLDELFESLLTVEMTMSDKESKKGKGITFKSAYEQKTTANQSGNEANQDESIALLMKQFSKMARKFKSLNTAGKIEKTRRHDSENSKRKVNDFSYRRNNNHACIIEINSEVDNECSDIHEDEELTLEKLKMLRKEDSEARAIQKERIQDLMEENERLMGVISSLKVKLKENGSSKYGLGFDASTRGVKITPEVKFVPTSVKETTESSCEKLSTDTCANFPDGSVIIENNFMFTKRNNNVRGTHMIWRVKTSEKCNVAFTTVQTHVDAWYFDSGCSRHMTGNRSFFTELEECASGHVTFGDGAKGRIIAKRNIDKNNLPCLNEVRYVDGLKARNLRHISLRILDKVIRNEAVVGIPSLDINDKFFCGDCQVGKQTKTSHRRLKQCYTIRVLELLHLNLMGPMQTKSLGGMKYVLVVVDDYSRFTWVRFLKEKSDTVKLCISLCLNLQREKRQKIIRIRSDHGKEFDNEDLNNFCHTEGIHHEFTASITPQQNGVVERKNRTLQEIA
ncbi:gag-pol polyprotein [Cucumis melo var. makuwa]|uniref:Gag-pol polyprotein n=1 Tax=Cucumis melo var. makuwa TaxID=1194695 RepID=A0A5D3CAR9_CUCMM|nr:gag-pol polyprotein [Cucumis melo var. makuwa]TYK08268.1 gag-pol polyprotein [Cucumis melo var. makuwa]